MRILHFCALPSFSGLEQYALKLARDQKKRGHDVGFVVLQGSALEKECAQAGIRTHVLEASWPPPLFSSVKRYKEILSQNPDADVLHLHTSQEIDRVGMASLLNSPWKRDSKPKIIQQNHIWISHSKRDPLHWLSHRILDEIWCSSERAKESLVRLLPVSKDKIQIVRYGRDLGLRDQLLSREEARRELGLSDASTVLGAIARIDRGKGIWELINGAIERWNQGDAFDLVIIGGATTSDPAAITFAKKVEQFVESLPLELKKRVFMKGSIPDAARFLKAFDLYAQVSYKETFSLALLDAQLAERPVIGTNSGGTPEVVRENETGWLCEPESVSSLAEAIGRALNDRSKWAAYGAAARDRVEKHFDFEVVMEEILSRYH